MKNLAIYIDKSNIIPDNLSKITVVDDNTSGFIEVFLEPVLNFMIYLFGTVILVMIVLAGYYYIMATLNDKDYQKAMNILKYTFILTVIFIFAYTIIEIAAKFFSV